MVMNKKGFTLIELLIVVVIIGILAAIAIPKFAGTKSKAYVAAMKSDLKNLVTAEESYFSDANTYGAVAANQLAFNGNVLWAATTGVTVATAAITATGFSATATHAGATGTAACGVFVGGAASPNGAITVEGEVACW
jgi:prepilin-type N-terminal cleavage/methylation domain-containing protein